MSRSLFSATLLLSALLLLASSAAAQSGDAALAAEEYSGAMQLYTEACAAGDVAGCRGAFAMHSEGTGVPSDRAAATPFGVRACELGDAPACVSIAGWSVQSAPEDAFRYYTRACALRSPVGCMRLAAVRRRGIGCTRDADEGWRLMAEACELGEMGSCAMVGQRVLHGRDPNPVEAHRLLSRSCAAHNALGCGAFGTLMRDGAPGVPADAVAAAAAFEEACSGRQWPACYFLGQAYMSGSGVTQDEETGRAHLQTACDHGLRNACRELAPPETAAETEHDGGTSVECPHAQRDDQWTRVQRCTLHLWSPRHHWSAAGAWPASSVLQLGFRDSASLLRVEWRACPRDHRRAGQRCGSMRRTPYATATSRLARLPRRRLAR